MPRKRKRGKKRRNIAVMPLKVMTDVAVEIAANWPNIKTNIEDGEYDQALGNLNLGMQYAEPHAIQGGLKIKLFRTFLGKVPLWSYNGTSVTVA